MPCKIRLYRLRVCEIVVVLYSSHSSVPKLQWYGIGVVTFFKEQIHTL